MAQKPVLSTAISQWFKVSYSQGCLQVVPGCSGGSETRNSNSKFPMVQCLIHSGVSPGGIWVLWCLSASETCTLNRKFPMVQSLMQLGMSPKWYLGAVVAQKPVLWIANSQWFKVSYSQGCPPMVCGCSGGWETRTLNSNVPMVQCLIQSGGPLVVFGCSGGSETRTLNRKFPMVQSRTQSGMSPKWYLGALVAQKPVL